MGRSLPDLGVCPPAHFILQYSRRNCISMPTPLPTGPVGVDASEVMNPHYYSNPHFSYFPLHPPMASINNADNAVIPSPYGPQPLIPTASRYFPLLTPMASFDNVDTAVILSPYGPRPLISTATPPPPAVPQRPPSQMRTQPSFSGQPLPPFFLSFMLNRG